MALFDNTMQTGAQAQQLGFAPPTTPANSFTPPGVPVGYGQMQGQPLLSRNPNYGVPTGIASLLGGTNPMGAPQAGALLTPQQAVPNQMEGINPLTGQPFQTFDAGATTDAITQSRQAEEQRQRDMLLAAQEQAASEATATEAAAQAERDRIAAEQAAVAQAEADRIAAEQAAADAAAAETATAAAEAAAVEAANAKLDPQTPEEIVQGYKDNPQSAPGAGGVLGEEQVAKALELDLFDRDSDFFVDRSGLFGPAGTRYDLPNMDDTQTVLSDMRQAQTGSASPTQEEVMAGIRSGVNVGSEGMGGFMPGSFDPESGTFLPTGPASAPVAAPAQTAPQAAPIAGGSEMGFVPPTQEQINAAIAQMGQASLAPGEPSLPPLNMPAQPAAGEPEIGLGNRLRGMGGIFANAVAPGDAGYGELAAAAPAPTGGSLASGVMSGERPNAVLSDFFPGGGMEGGIGGMLDPSVIANIREQIGNSSEPVAATPMPAPPPALSRMSDGDFQALIQRQSSLPPPPPPPPPMVTPAEASAAATPKPFVAPDLSALMPKPRTQKVTKPKKGRKKVVEPDQKSNKKRRRRRQRGPR